jgi:hypothetical protein
MPYLPWLYHAARRKTTMPIDTLTPWTPGSLADKVTCDGQTVKIRHAIVMAMISRARTKGMDTGPLENIEVAISIADDAIHHMMGKR